ncbi:MAG: hypothetical protein COT81_04935 [Candidatus Buchananbacteria bacterium CG10_big_fil_rev_8_21_14_0_10_42_9]|uniref:Bacterial sugar transferase domain-containing protein n=1 Tax=Candidatus Buchananbacteria bacterium CG10_big_fil_rev_8_21_14_0_10_42_9 TaxID=1974526 RepID=A0A2H0W037_9BACT|nr:MAG: hypothetical protein COT81_04935 [Candidatus Buchananbacteria bacterium CG10_big_fil_rev_8_21_14_0_10_42_9]
MPDIEKIPNPPTKRVFDIITSLFILLLLSPLIVVILLAMALEALVSNQARRAFLYKETRISQGRLFTFYKFNIFTKQGLSQHQVNGIIHTKNLEKNKSNLTFVGKILKQIYFDELPQIINVLKGDMSLVGPRPTNQENSERLFKEGQHAKYILKAGITGFFQSHKGLEVHGDQNELDMEYAEFIKNNPGWKIILYDIKILLISVKTVLRAEGI